MKTYFLLLLLLFSFAAMAQHPSEDAANNGKIYLSAGLTTISYHIYYDKPEVEKYVVKTGYFNPLSINLGYEINERARVQIGFAYGGSKDSFDWFPGSTDTLLYVDKSRTRVIAIPVAGKFTFFNLGKRFPIYGTATLMPSFGTTDIKRTETYQGNSSEHNLQVKGIDAFATAGVGFNYKISNKFNGYLEYLFFKKNLTGLNSHHHDWNQFATLSNRIYRSLAFGVDFNLNLRREQ